MWCRSFLNYTRLKFMLIHADATSWELSTQKTWAIFSVRSPNRSAVRYNHSLRKRTNLRLSLLSLAVCPKIFFSTVIVRSKKEKKMKSKKLHHKACIKWIFFSTWSKVSWSISSHCYVDCRQLYYIVKAVHIRFDAPTVHQDARSSQLVGMERNVAEFSVSVSVMVVVCEPFYAHLAFFVPRRQGWREKQQKYTRMNTIETNVDATLVWWCVGNIRDFLILSIEIYNLK